MSGCPSSLELSRAISDGVEPAHVASCAACAAEWAATRDLIAIARDVGPALPPPPRREEVRTMLLAAGRSAEVLGPHSGASRKRVAYVGAGALAVAAAIAVVVVARDSAPPASHRHATVRPLANAQFTASTTAPDEIVELRDGSIDVEVAPLHAGERFRIVLADAEIEVHGTRFVATARAGKLASVDVTHGIVEVRPRDGDAVLLRVGESWRAVTRAAIAPQAPAPIVEPPPPPAPAKRAAPVKPPPPPRGVASPAPPAPPAPPDTSRDRVERLPQERAYDDGWAAMRNSKFADAAAAFARVQLLDPDGALAEDATYWYAVALARADETARATTAFRDYLDRYSRSRRAGEASTMLGWLLVGAKEYGEAERRFRAATNDQNPAVRESARAGLDAVKTRP